MKEEGGEFVYLESVFIVALGVNSAAPSIGPLSNPKSHNSRKVSFEKSASTAPATVPVMICGR